MVEGVEEVGEVGMGNFAAVVLNQINGKSNCILSGSPQGDQAREQNEFLTTDYADFKLISYPPHSRIRVSGRETAIISLKSA